MVAKKAKIYHTNCVVHNRELAFSPSALWKPMEVHRDSMI